MRVQLLGTGSSEGWPNPWCTCASCAAAVRQGVLRGQTSALVDGVLLLDCGAEAPRAAVRAGAGLAGVRAVLVGHGHPDHHAADVWRWHAQARTSGPLHLVAPPAVCAAARPRLVGVEVTEVRAGDRVSVAGHDVRVLAAAHGGPELGPAVLHDVTAPDGARLLWGVDTGVLPEATVEAARGRAYDVVLLELTSSGIPTHLDLRTWPEQVARLRAVGAVVDGTQLLAVHLGHDNPPPDELDAVLAGWGARAPRDGEVVTVGAGAPQPRALPRRVLVLGGARSGKSAHAERLLAAEPEVDYVATAPPRPGDDEWAERVAAHVERRPPRWRTHETGDVAAVLRSAAGAVLVDDLGLWLTRLLDEAGAWEDRAAATAAVDAALPELVEAFAAAPRAVLVAPEVGGGLVATSPGGRAFVDLLGRTTAALAAQADEVVQVVAGLPRRLR